MPKDETTTLIEQVQPIVRDAERLATLHTELLRSELRQTAAAVSPALSSIGAGAAFLRLGAYSHLSHWSMGYIVRPGYRFGDVTASWARYLGRWCRAHRSGRRRLSSVDIIPHETLAAIREDIAWVKEKTA